ncbi:MAG TPA: tetratricopeptide repeat protein, partial [Fimbriimonas sp.]|nr:tetratricopeptide repeat protein [Fimbriimonas sp.]
PERAQFALRELNSDARRLLVFDNADDESQVVPGAAATYPTWIPNQGGCRTLITSRFADWSPGVPKLEIYVLEPGPSRELLVRRSGRAAEGEELVACDDLAKELGYLPLALEMAGGYMAALRGYDFRKYLDFARRVMEDLLRRKVLGSTQYPDSIAVAWQISVQRLSAPSRALLRVASFLANSPMPIEFFAHEIDMWRPLAKRFPAAPPGSNAVDPELLVNDVSEDLTRYSLARRSEEGLQFHTLLQAVERLNIPEPEQAEVQEAVWEMFLSHAPRKSWEFENWPIWRAMLPHAHSLADGHSTDQLRFAEVRHRVAGYLEGTGALAPAVIASSEALAIRRRELPEGHPDIASSLNNLASLYQAQGRLTEAEPLFMEALGIYRHALPEGHPDIALSLNNLALLYQDQGRLTEAEPLYLEALGIYRHALPEGHPDIASSLNNLAFLYRAQGRLTEAEPLCLEALGIRRHALHEGHPDIALSLNNLASLYRAQGRLTEAEPLCLEALGIYRHALPEGHPDIASSLNNLALLCQDQGRLTEAEPLIRESLQILRVGEGRSASTANGTVNLAGVLLELGQAEAARELLHEAKDIWLGTQDPEDYRLGKVYQYLGQIARAEGERDRAHEMYAEAMRLWRRGAGEDNPRTKRIRKELAELTQG